MQNFADRFIDAIKTKGNPCIVGLDPRLELVPKDFFPSGDADLSRDEAVEDTIFAFNEAIIDAVKDLVPAVKLQSAFYEQYGLSGMWAFERSIKYAKDAGLIVIVDAKRNDIGSTAQAYANAFLGEAEILGEKSPMFNADALTVSPYMGRDSLLPFVDACKKYGKGIFILVKTSNPGSGDFQDVIAKETNEPLYNSVARMVDELGNETTGKSGYSSIGAVVGATFPEQAVSLRKLMPKALFLVPGYGAQGGTAKDTLPCFNPDKLGAVVNASRSITFSIEDLSVSKKEYASIVRENTQKMIADVNQALKN
jgi:orotidine-5'-phosphate decarboxylase